MAPLLDTPGRYTLLYSCTNSAQISASKLTRTVTVVDTSCPTCTVRGASTQTMEASFPYTDDGATCTDSLDGDLTASVSTPPGDKVDVEKVGAAIIGVVIASSSSRILLVEHVWILLHCRSSLANSSSRILLVKHVRIL